MHVVHGGRNKMNRSWYTKLREIGPRNLGVLSHLSDTRQVSKLEQIQAHYRRRQPEVHAFGARRQLSIEESSRAALRLRAYERPGVRCTRIVIASRPTRQPPVAYVGLHIDCLDIALELYVYRLFRYNFRYIAV